MNNPTEHISEDQRVRKLVQTHLDLMEPTDIHQEGALEAIASFKKFRSELVSCLDDQVSFVEQDDKQLLADLIFALGFECLGDHRTEENPMKQVIHSRLEQLIKTLGEKINKVEEGSEETPLPSTVFLRTTSIPNEGMIHCDVFGEDHIPAHGDDQKQMKISLITPDQEESLKKRFQKVLVDIQQLPEQQQQQFVHFHQVICQFEGSLVYSFLQMILNRPGGILTDKEKTELARKLLAFQTGKQAYSAYGEAHHRLRMFEDAFEIFKKMGTPESEEFPIIVYEYAERHSFDIVRRSLLNSSPDVEKLFSEERTSKDVKYCIDILTKQLETEGGYERMMEDVKTPPCFVNLHKDWGHFLEMVRYCLAKISLEGEEIEALRFPATVADLKNPRLSLNLQEEAVNNVPADIHEFAERWKKETKEVRQQDFQRAYLIPTPSGQASFLARQEDFLSASWTKELESVKVNLLSVSQWEEIQKRYNDIMSQVLDCDTEEAQKVFNAFCMVAAPKVLNSSMAKEFSHYVYKRAPKIVTDRLAVHAKRKSQNMIPFDTYPCFLRQLMVLEACVETWNRSSEKDITALTKTLIRAYFAPLSDVFSTHGLFCVDDLDPQFTPFMNQQAQEVVKKVKEEVLRSYLNTSFTTSPISILEWVEDSAATFAGIKGYRLQVLDAESFSRVYGAENLRNWPNVRLSPKPDESGLEAASVSEVVTQESTAIMVLMKEKDGFAEMLLVSKDQSRWRKDLVGKQQCAVSFISREKYTQAQQKLEKTFRELKLKTSEQKREFMEVYNWMRAYLDLAHNDLYIMLERKMVEIARDKGNAVINAVEILELHMKLISVCKKYFRKSLTSYKEVLKMYRKKHLKSHLKQRFESTYLDHGLNKSDLTAAVHNVCKGMAEGISKTAIEAHPPTEDAGSIRYILEYISVGLAGRFQTKNGMCMIPILHPELHLEVYGSWPYQNPNPLNSSEVKTETPPLIRMKAETATFTSRHGLGTHTLSLEEAHEGTATIIEKIRKTPEPTLDQLEEVRWLILFMLKNSPNNPPS